jgi:DNA-binding transcriptional ArsR family regulator
MTYRIHFTAQDLARTRVADAPMLLCELDLAIRAFQDRSRPAYLDAWRRDIRSRLTADARMVLALVPPVGYSPTFLSPTRAGMPEELLDQVRATPAGLVRQDMAAIAERQPIPSWARRLADDPAVFKRLSDGLADLHSIMLGPYWQRLTDLFAADRAVRMRHLLAGGVERLLSLANPDWMRWNPPVLEIRLPNGAEHDLILEGQGILLVPSAFFVRSLVEDDAQPQPIVSYPAGIDQPLRRMTLLAPEPTVPRRVGALRALLGQTRAAVLEIIAEHPGCSTKDLASLAGIAPASASEHATVLREAGLVTTARYRNTALHSATGLGVALLAGDRR